MTQTALSDLKRLERLYQRGFQDSTVELAIQKIVQRQIARDEADLARVESVLKEFEEKFGMTSDEFFAAYQSGQLPDTAEFVEWNAFYKMRQRLLERLHILTGNGDNA